MGPENDAMFCEDAARVLPWRKKRERMMFPRIGMLRNK